MRISDKRWARILCTTIVVSLVVGMFPCRELHADSLIHGEYNCPPLIVEYDQNSTWENNTQGQYTVTNNSSYNVTSWSLTISFEDDVTVSDIWNVNNTTSDPSSQITVASNAIISAGSTYSFGMIIAGSEVAPSAPESITLVNVVTDEPELTQIPTPTPTEVPAPTTEPTVTNTPTPTPSEEEVFPYAIFAGSTSDDFSFQGWKSNIVGDIYSGRNFLYQGSELNMEGYARTVGTVQPAGWKIDMTGYQEHIDPIDIPDWSTSILAKSSQLPAIDQTSFSSQNSIVANGYYYTDGNLTINSTSFTGDAIIVAKGNITYNINALSGTGRVLLYSEEGNITINGTEIEINGILYAPQGRVSINAYNTTINGRIVADKFSYNGSTLNVSADPSDLQLVSDSFNPTITPTSTPTPTDTPIPTQMVSPTSTDTPTPTPTETSTPTPTAPPNPTATSTPTPTSEPTGEPTPTDIPTPTEEPTPTAEPTEVPSPTPTTEPDYSTDSDNDYLPDTYELKIGTDPNNPDTDNDGLIDGYEIVLELDPTLPDSDGNGIADGDEDYDGDGLSNLIEIELGTNPMSSDSDYDGLTDYDEVNLYSTSPVKYDTDEDGINDYNEVHMGSDPNVNDSSTQRYQTLTYQVPTNAGLSGVTSVEVKGYISGCISENTRIRNVYGIDTLSSQIDALVGVPVDIESSGDFDSITIIFHYSDDVDEENLKILWFDEANNQYVVLSNSVKNTNNNTVSVTTDHFSRYMLIDEGVWVRTWARSCTLTNNYYRLLEWGYDMDRYISWLNQQEDSDGDGIPNCIETNGMINIIGKLVYTDPDNSDSDGDGLSDGQEMGTIPRFVIDTVPNIMSTLFHTAIPVSYFDRWSGYVYYGMTSDPRNGDTDGDGENDSSDAYLSDRNCFTLNLGGGEYNLNSNDEGYIHIYGAPSDPECGYGGNQGWFNNVSVGNDINLFIRRAGCGIIASNDVTLYLENGVSDYQWYEYYNLIMDTYERFPGIVYSYNPNININNTPLVSPLFVNEYFTNLGYNVSLFCVSEDNENDMIDRIIVSLENNIPVIMLEYDPIASAIKSIDNQDPPVINLNNTHMKRYDSRISDFYDTGYLLLHHYITVTGLYHNGINNNTYLRVQSWGEEYYIDFNDFCRFNSNNITSEGYLVFIDQ